MNHRKQNMQIAQALGRSLQYNDIKVGWLGKIDAAGVVNSDPMDGLEIPYIWVRFEENGEAVRAINMKVSGRMPNVRVHVGRSALNGQLTILGLAEETAVELGDIAPTLNTPDRIADLILELLDTNRIKPLRVSPGENAFDVDVAPGFYWHLGEFRAWAGDTINIASSVPTGFNTKRPVLIGIDPATETLVSYDGDVIFMTVPPLGGKMFTETVIAQTVVDAAMPDVFWIACVPLTVNDVTWNDYFRTTALQFAGGNGASITSGKVRVTGADTVENYLSNKITAGTGITLTVLNPAANETLRVATDTSYLDGRYVLKAGDNMTGRLGTQVALTNLVTEGLESITTRTLTADANGGAGIRISHTINQGGFHHTGGWNGLRITSTASGASGTVDFISGATVGVTKSGAGVLTDAYGLQVRSATNSGGGTFTTNYGVKVEDQTVATTNYAYYSGAGLNRLGDQLKIEGSADRVQAIVKGYSTQTNNLQEWQDNGGTVQASITGTGGVTFNAAGNDADFTIKGDTDSNLVTTDASTDSFGVGIAAGSHVGKAHIKQASSTGAKPVATLHQEDQDQEFIRFNGYADGNNASKSIAIAAILFPGEIRAWLRVYVEDLANEFSDGVYWLPVYSDPTE